MNSPSNHVNSSGKQKHKNRREMIVALITLFSLVGAGIVGVNRSIVTIEPFLPGVFPEAEQFRRLEAEKYSALDGEKGKLLGYVSVSQADGFGGPVKLVAGIDRKGTVTGFHILEHRETPSWYEKVAESPLLNELKGKPYSDLFELGKDIDGVTGATFTSKAIVESLKSVSQRIAVNDFGLPAINTSDRKFRFGLPEGTLLLLFIIAVLNSKFLKGRSKKALRWCSLTMGLLVIGFFANHPLTLVDINKFAAGYWPDLYSQFYWYIMIFCLLTIFLTTNKNLYCRYICPFGATQEFIGLLGKAKNMRPIRFNVFYKWLRRMIVWLVVFVALIFRNPGIGSYEVYGTLFNLSGTRIEIVFLTLVLVAALFIKRPWCNFLCPVPAIEDYVRFFRNRSRDFFKRS